jgi:hypothetical protein
MQDVVVRDAVLTCGGENLDPHCSKLTCRHLTVKSPLVARGHTERLAASGELSARRLDAVLPVCINWCPRGTWYIRTRLQSGP